MTEPAAPMRSLVVDREMPLPPEKVCVPSLKAL